MFEIKYQRDANFINYIFGLNKNIGDTLTQNEVINNHNKNRIIEFLKSQSLDYDNPNPTNVNKQSINKWIYNKLSYLNNLRNYYISNGLVDPIDEIKNDYGFKHDLSLSSALTLFPNESNIQMQKRYFSDFFTNKENAVIQKIADKQKIQNHFYIEDILFNDFTINNIRNYIKSSRLVYNIIAERMTTIDDLCEKFNFDKPVKKMMENIDVDSPLALIKQIKQTRAYYIDTNRRKNTIVEQNLRITRGKKNISKKTTRKASNIPLHQEKIIALQPNFEKLVQNANQQQTVTNEALSTYNSQLDLINNDNNPWAASTSNNPLDTYNLPLNAATSDNPQDFTITNYPQRVAAPDSILPYVEGTNINQMPQTQPGQVSYQPVYSLQGQPVFYGQLNTYNNYLTDPNTGNPVNVEPGIYYLIGNDVNGNAIYVKQQNDQTNIQQNTQPVLPGAQISTDYTNTVNPIDATNNFASQQQTYASNRQKL